MIVESRLLSTSSMKSCVSVLTSTSKGVKLENGSKGIAMVGTTETANTVVDGNELKSNSPEKVESIEPPLVRQMPSEGEWYKLGGVFDVGIAIACAAAMFFSCSLLCLMASLMFSFWLDRVSPLLHHIGLLYSQGIPNFPQALQNGLPSSHFFLRNLQV